MTDRQPPTAVAAGGTGMDGPADAAGPASPAAPDRPAGAGGTSEAGGTGRTGGTSGAGAPRPGGRSLRGFTGTGYDKGRPLLVQAAWFAVLNLVFVKWWCPPRLRPALLRAFGAKVGQRVLIRHRVRVQWPWKLSIGDDVWIGEDAWLVNLEPVTIGSDVCVSQGALLCTGSHQRRSPTFEFDNGPIRLEPGSWVAARAVVLRGVTVGEGAVVGAGAMAHRDVPAGAVLTTGGLVRPDRDTGEARSGTS